MSPKKSIRCVGERTVWYSRGEIDLATSTVLRDRSLDLEARILVLEEELKAGREELKADGEEMKAEKALLLKWEAVSLINTAMDEYIWNEYMAKYGEELGENDILSFSSLHHAVNNTRMRTSKRILARTVYDSIEESIRRVAVNFLNKMTAMGGATTGIADSRVSQDDILDCLSNDFSCNMTPVQDRFFQHVKNTSLSWQKT